MAEEEEEKPKEMIKLVSKEGHEFSVEKQAAMVSNTIKSMLTGPGMFTENESDTINFPEISKEVLEEVRAAYPPFLLPHTPRSTAAFPPSLPAFPLFCVFAFPLPAFRTERRCNSNGVARSGNSGAAPAALLAAATSQGYRCRG